MFPSAVAVLKVTLPNKPDIQLQLHVLPLPESFNPQT
jgi:hypothetical protein